MTYVDLVAIHDTNEFRTRNIYNLWANQQVFFSTTVLYQWFLDNIGKHIDI